MSAFSLASLEVSTRSRGLSHITPDAQRENISDDIAALRTIGGEEADPSRSYTAHFICEAPYETHTPGAILSINAPTPPGILDEKAHVIVRCIANPTLPTESFTVECNLAEREREIYNPSVEIFLDETLPDDQAETLLQLWQSLDTPHHAAPYADQLYIDTQDIPVQLPDGYTPLRLLPPMRGGDGDPEELIAAAKRYLFTGTQPFESPSRQHKRREVRQLHALMGEGVDASHPSMAYVEGEIPWDPTANEPDLSHEYAGGPRPYIRHRSGRRQR